MKIFEHPNMIDFMCPICGKSDDKPIILVGIDGTEDGNIIEAIQVHVDCLDLRIIREQHLMYQILRPTDIMMGVQNEAR